MQGRRGFTLIELLVVMSIIGLLIAIFVPQIPAIMNYYRVHVSRSIVHQIEMGVDEYARVYSAYPYDLARMNGAGTAMVNGDTNDGAWTDPNVAHYGNCQGSRSIHLMLQGRDGTGWRPSTTFPKVKAFGPFFDSPGFSYSPPEGGGAYFVDPFGRPILYYRAKLDSTYDFVASGYDDRSHRYCQINNRDAWLQRGANDLPYGEGLMTTDGSDVPSRTHWLKRVTRSKVNSTCYPENPKTFILWAAGGDERFGYWAWSDEHGGYVCDRYPDDQGNVDGVIGTCNDILSSGER